MEELSELVKQQVAKIALLEAMVAELLARLNEVYIHHEKTKYKLLAGNGVTYYG